MDEVRTECTLRSGGGTAAFALAKDVAIGPAAGEQGWAGLLSPVAEIPLPGRPVRFDYQSADHAHTVSLDSTTHLVYLPLENVEGRPVLKILRGLPSFGARKP